MRDDVSYDELVHASYAALRRQAHAIMGGERCTLQPTDLLHEALDCLQQAELKIDDRTQLFALASRKMRQKLIDHHRRRDAVKRGGGKIMVSFNPGRDDPLNAALPTYDLVAIHEALDHLRKIDEDKWRHVEMRFFLGMTDEEIARELGVGKDAIAKRWTICKARLRQSLAHFDESRALE